jgi:hypothetical protein
VVPSVATFLSGFYIGDHMGCYAGGLLELCHKCETEGGWSKSKCIEN